MPPVRLPLAANCLSLKSTHSASPSTLCRCTKSGMKRLDAPTRRAQRCFGYYDLRGSNLPVVDLAMRLGLRATAPNAASVVSSPRAVSI